MDPQLIAVGNKQVRLIFKATPNFTPVEKHKIQQAVDQYMLKTKQYKKKLQNRIKRIIKESENEKHTQEHSSMDT